MLKKKSKKKQEQLVEEYKELVDHILKTFEQKKGSKYPFTNESGAIVKRFLRLYGLYQSMALWDLFLNQSWDWFNHGLKVRVGHDLRNFQRKITVLLDEDWKKIANKYEQRNKNNVVQLELPGIEFQKFPESEDFQANKLKILKTFKNDK